MKTAGHTLAVFLCHGKVPTSRTFPIQLAVIIRQGQK